jgi:hypothetical protein
VNERGGLERVPRSHPTWFVVDERTR